MSSEELPAKNQDPEVLYECLIYWKQRALEAESRLENYAEHMTRADISKWLAKNSTDEDGMNWMPAVQDRLPKAAVPGDARMRKSDGTCWVYSGRWDIFAVRKDNWPGRKL